MSNLSISSKIKLNNGVEMPQFGLGKRRIEMENVKVNKL